MLVWSVLFKFNYITAELQTLAYDYRIHTPIGMFKLGRQIGEGSYGKVKRGNIYSSTFV